LEFVLFLAHLPSEDVVYSMVHIDIKQAKHDISLSNFAANNWSTRRSFDKIG
jgi:hypothetical protein